MTLVFGRDREVARWAEQFLPRPMGHMGRAFTGPFVAIGVADSKGALTGAFVITGYDGNDVNISVAGRGAIARTPLRVVTDYIFSELGCSRITVTTRASNARVISIALRLGFKREGVLRRLYGNEDGVLLGLLEKDFTL